MLKNRLKILLAIHEMSIKTLMEKTGISRNALSNMVNNREANISTKNLDKLMNAFEITPNEFWDYESKSLNKSKLIDSRCK
ncbi:helix-turn-helix domain-containing protein [Limosilactobacillus reuteri]|uniref:helix-turn-helix domain-containing protein n=1 Tax=Limosilactobacillus reuteri TaxID=1598 RepID=UPI003AF130FD|nr:helix-turn-helix transcriptional regulator [Limosilactobacillus reuteri]